MQVLIKLVVEMKFIFFVQVCDVFCDSFFELTNNIVFVYTADFETKLDNLPELAFFRKHLVTRQLAPHKVFSLFERIRGRDQKVSSLR